MSVNELKGKTPQQIDNITPGTTDVSSRAYIGTSIMQRLIDLVNFIVNVSANIKDFGAIGDGIVDDTTAIQAALDSGAGVITGDSGDIYLISSTLTVPLNVGINAFNVTFKTNLHIIMFDFVNGGFIKNCILQGAGGSSYVTGSIGINCSGVNNSPSAPTFVNAVTVENCEIKDFGIYGIFYSYVNFAHVVGCHIHDIGYTCIAGASCNDTRILGNLLEDVVGGSSGGDAYGCFIDRNNGISEIVEPRSYRCVLANNVVRNIQPTTGDNGQGLDTHAGIDFTFDNNIIEGCKVGIFATGSKIGSNTDLGPQRCTISNNLIIGIGHLNSGITVSGGIDGSTVREYANGIIVTGNVIYLHGDETDNLSGTIICQATKNLVLSNNLIIKPSPYGIIMKQDNLGFSVNGNIIVNPHDPTITTTQCIAIRLNNNTGIISNCTFIYDSTDVSGLSNVANESIRVHAGLTGINIDFGKCSFIGIDATHLTFQPLSGTLRYEGLFKESGLGTIVLTSGVPTGIKDIVFNQRFPYVPNTIKFTLRYPFNQGGKTPILGIDTSVAPSVTGFRIYATPYDLGNWSATGNISFYWESE